MIQFQNTGTDTAFNVVLIDTLDPSLNMSSFSILGSSHPYTLEILPMNVLQISFNNILLPDSNVNEMESHGYFSFRIGLMDNLPAGHTISATAVIYFDFNPPIITNTASLTLYDCDNISGLLSATMLMCEGDDLLMIANSLVPAGVNWYYDNNFVIASDTLQLFSLTAGIHTIILESITPYCSQQQIQQVQVNTLPVVLIGVIGDTLEAVGTWVYYQWYLNGNPIPNTNSQQYIAQQSGNYTVEVTDFQGCSNLSSQVYVSITGISESNANQLSLSPNPGSDYVKIESSETNYYLKVTDISGKVIIEKFLDTGNEIIHTSEWSNGMYLFSISHKSGTSQLKWMK